MYSFRDTPTVLDVSTSEPEHGTVRVAAFGEVDMVSAPRLGRAVLDALGGHPSVVEVDLAGVTFMDSSGINTLVECRQHADGAELKVVNPAAPVRRVLTVTGLAGILGLA